MIKGTTSNGFAFEIDENRLSDWRFVKRLKQLQKLEKAENTAETELQFIDIMVDIESIVFEDKGEALEEFVASQNNGLVPLDKLLAEFFEVLKMDNRTKN